MAGSHNAAFLLVLVVQNVGGGVEYPSDTRWKERSDKGGFESESK